MTRRNGIFLVIGVLAALFATALRADPWVDFAAFEHDGNCPPLLAQAANATQVAAWNQEQLDRLYACAKAGPIPDGFLNGQVLFANGGGFDQFVTFAAQLGFPVDKGRLKQFAESLWKGKHFYRADGALLNLMGPNVEPLLGQDIKGQLRFPAKVYCGQSLLDSRRESIVIDYAKTDTVKIAGKTPYNDLVDWIAGDRTQTGRRGLNIRDEIRMVHPGFYLGRAYMDRIFLLNFTLTASAPVSGQDVCWSGYSSTGA